MATHSSILTWRVPWPEKPGGLQSMGHKESDTTEQGILMLTNKIKKKKKKLKKKKKFEHHFTLVCLNRIC